MSQVIKIGIIGDFNPQFKPHLVTNETLEHAAQSLSVSLEMKWIPTLELEKNAQKLEQFDAIYCSPGSPYQSLHGALNGIRFARERKMPFIGCCAGFQHVVMEYAQNIIGYSDAASEEYDPEAATLFITKFACSIAGQKLKIRVKSDTRAFQIYGREEITEHYYCSFGLNPTFQQEIDRAGLRISGIDDIGEARIVELPDHRFFVATLYVPELFGSAKYPHPLIKNYLEAVLI